MSPKSKKRAAMKPEPKPGSATSAVLYRCPTPTNFLCPCGAAARKLKRAGIEYRTERVPYSRKNRPEIEELTGQRRVPLLVDGDEIVHDSKRIIEYVDWKRSRPGKSARAE